MDVSLVKKDINQNEGWRNVLLLIFPYLFIVGIFQWIAYYNLGLDISYENIHMTPFQFMIVAFGSLVGTMIAIGIMMKYMDQKPFYTLGFKRRHIVKDTIKGIFLGFTIMLLGFSILYFTKQIQIQKLDFNLNFLLQGFLLFVFVAIAEEVLVRGYILKNLLASFNNLTALLISAVFFSILHLGNPHMSFFSFIQLFVAGILLGIPYIITRKLWFSIALHFSWNFFQGTIFGFSVSGIQHYSIIETKFHTATIWNGGDFGFEGSLLCLLFQTIVIIFVLLKFDKIGESKRTRVFDLFIKN
ncbi:CPBP family intramembrane glutamic endopeptidase [Flavobacterium sp. A45]|uniref:CPBP family intramembrane glutamic endopeptidase n=1 Tax=Flavobacterium sp. A45 TaxID=1945862 RepID=UPI0009875209|nr:type II CAAX endopeptidase family protein [Flavobacterium sp. A45]OOG76985.1 hypothetical protein B0E44_03295 [Flavobacterium sp. A45]